MDRLLFGRVAQCIYIIPTFQNPTSNTLTDLQRREFIKMTQTVDLRVIDNLTLANNALDREPPPPLATYTEDGAVITVRSLSKIFTAAFAIGRLQDIIPP